MYKEEALNAGENYHQAAQELFPDDFFESNLVDWHWVDPFVVNISLACELYLKSILSDGETEIQGHDLSKLFDELDDEIKTTILSDPHFIGDDQFNNKLEASKTLFVDWRYHFEKDKHVHADLVFLENFAYVLHLIAEREVTSHDQL